MRWIIQIVQLTLFNLLTLAQRRGSVVAAAVGIAGVVGVLVGVLSIARGIQSTMASTGSPESVIVLRAGSDSELTSILMRDDTKLIAEAPGLASNEDGPLVSPELSVILNLPKRSTGTDANVPMRGVESQVFAVRDKVEIVEGRAFEWGRNEVIVGRAALGQFAGLELGGSILIGQDRWPIVGIFEADGSLEESEIWCDAAVLQPAFRRGPSYQVAVAKLASAGSFQTFKDGLTADPRLNVKVVRETEYYAAQSQLLVQLVTGLGFLIAGLMGLGAVFGALNTMYTAVASRSREIATLRALGFGSGAVVISVVIESMVLAAAGGLVGALAAWAAFDGYTAATLNWQSFSQVAFAFRVTPDLLVQGVVYALVLGFVGGLFPAVRAARMPVAVALREG